MPAVVSTTAYLTVERRQQAAKKKDKKRQGPSHHTVAPKEVEIRKDLCWEQTKVRELYEDNITQFTVAFLIFLNFLSEAASAQILPEDGSSGAFVFLIFEFVFNLSFTIELVWNMYGSWFFKFWDSGWNWFDFIIVIISLLAMLLPGLPGISVLRLFRAFRVFRLFKRIKSLKKIIEGVLGALPGVSQAFLVLGILMGIWSVIGVEFFQDLQPEYFGTFMKAMYTMWQIMTMDSWSSGIARELIFVHNLPMSSVFFISYIFIAGIVMTNVVVAILLDKYLEAIDKDKQEEKQAEEAEKAEMEDARDDDPAKPEIDIFTWQDGVLEPLRSLTWHRYRELEQFLQDAAEADERHKRTYSDSEDDSDDSDSTLLETKRATPIDHEAGNLFFLRHQDISTTVHSWDVETVLIWLSDIGFQEFHNKFKKDEIDGPTLTQLNEVDLVNMGMRLARRKDFMASLYELLADCEWPSKADRIYRPPPRPRPELKPKNSLRRSKNKLPGTVEPASIEIEEEFMTFNYSSPSKDKNSKVKPSSNASSQNAGVQMADVRPPPNRREPNRPPNTGWRNGGEIIQE